MKYVLLGLTGVSALGIFTIIKIKNKKKKLRREVYERCKNVNQHKKEKIQILGEYTVDFFIFYNTNLTNKEISL